MSRRQGLSGVFECELQDAGCEKRALVRLGWADRVVIEMNRRVPRLTVSQVESEEIIATLLARFRKRQLFGRLVFPHYASNNAKVMPLRAT